MHLQEVLKISDQLCKNGFEENQLVNTIVNIEKKMIIPIIKTVYCVNTVLIFMNITVHCMISK